MNRLARAGLLDKDEPAPAVRQSVGNVDVDIMEEDGEKQPEASDSGDALRKEMAALAEQATNEETTEDAGAPINDERQMATTTSTTAPAADQEQEVDPPSSDRKNKWGKFLASANKSGEDGDKKNINSEQQEADHSPATTTKHSSSSGNYVNTSRDEDVFVAKGQDVGDRGSKAEAIHEATSGKHDAKKSAVAVEPSMNSNKKSDNKRSTVVAMFPGEKTINESTPLIGEAVRADQKSVEKSFVDHGNEVQDTAYQICCTLLWKCVELAKAANRPEVIKRDSTSLSPPAKSYEAAGAGVRIDDDTSETNNGVIFGKRVPSKNVDQ